MEFGDREASALRVARVAPTPANLNAALFVDDSRQDRVEAAVRVSGRHAATEDLVRAVAADFVAKAGAALECQTAFALVTLHQAHDDVDDDRDHERPWIEGQHDAFTRDRGG